MPYLFVCDEPHSAHALHALDPSAPLPHSCALGATAADFFRASHADVGWTRRGALAALDALRVQFGAPFHVDYAFLDLGGRAQASMLAHFAGLAFDIGGALAPQERARLYRTAAGSGLFAFVAPPYASGASVHVACDVGFPPLTRGDTGAYVFVLQRALLLVGLMRGALSGVVCAETVRGIKRLQGRINRPVTGKMDAASWRALLAAL